MAGTITHTYFAKDVLKKLDEDTKKIIDEYEGSFEVFSQGPDPFIFGDKFQQKNMKYFHRNKTQDFFINLVNYIRKNHLENNKEVMAFLYGFICHYSLDSTVHPYVIYKAGAYYKKKKETYKYFGKHSEVESYIDAYMINKNEKINPNKLNISKFCFKNKKISKELTNLITDVFYETYKKRHMGFHYKTCLRNMKILYKILRNDKTGIKKKLYVSLDKITPKRVMNFSVLSYKTKLNKNHYYLNLDHRTWCHPLDKNETYNDSFEDLYNKAIKMSIDLINASNAVLFFNKTSNYLKRYFKNLSYISGKDCSIKKKYKYFEF